MRKLGALDIVGYDPTTEEDQLIGRLHDAEEDAALACLYFSDSKADSCAVSEYGDACKTTETIRNTQSIPIRFINALGNSILPDPSANKPLTALIEDHREANAQSTAPTKISKRIGRPTKRRRVPRSS